jgi:hypothetical protein
MTEIPIQVNLKRLKANLGVVQEKVYDLQLQQGMQQLKRSTTNLQNERFYLLLFNLKRKPKTHQ